MCLPLVAAAVAAIGIAGDVAKGLAQDKAAKKNKAAAMMAHITSLNDLSQREVEETIAAVNEKDTAARKATSVIGRTTTASAEAGVGGNSVAAILHSVDADRANFDERIDVNLATERRQIERERAASDSQTQSRIDSVQPNNWTATGLSIGGALASAYIKSPSVDPVTTRPGSPSASYSGYPSDLPYIPIVNPNGPRSY